MNRSVRRFLLGSAVLAPLATVLLQSSFAKDDPTQPTLKEFLKGQPAADGMKLPPGFKATCFAAEPDVQQPIAMCMDHRGRLWVAECYSYPNWSETGRDRILIFEDTNHDGVFDTRKVFAEGFGYLTGLQIGEGGLWVANAPNLLFFPDADGDDKPDGPPQVHLEGWNWKGVHNVINALAWGPDGWLYGGNGITVESQVKPAGAPDSDIVKLNCSIWRYHPARKKFEMWCEGTTNPWGLDFDEHGQMFFSTSVTPHLFHGIQGARFQRMHGWHYNPYTFEDIKTHADHLHWGGGDWTSSRGGIGAHNAAGGGHAHCGAMIYLGDSWPSQYRGTIFFNNIHGRRINNDILERSGSGFVGHHGADFAFSVDPWNRPVTLMYGPDGGVYQLDWHDTGECHDHEAERETGRVFKIAYVGEKGSGRGVEGSAIIDVSKATDEQLVDMQTWSNEWYVRHARQVLAGRGANEKVHALLRDTLIKSDNPVHRLRAFWALHVTGGLTESMKLETLNNADEYLRAWAIQLLCEDRHPSDAALQRFARMAREDPSQLVRLYLASALQRIELKQRWPIAEALVTHEQDAADHNLPLMYWYAIEPAVPTDARRALRLASMSKIPKVREFITRRLAMAAAR